MNLQEFNDLAKNQGAKYYLSIGEDPTPTKRKYLLPLISTFFKGKLKYESSKGNPTLIKSIIFKENQKGVLINKDNVAIVNGSTFGLFLALSLFKKKDEIVIFNPSYPLYSDLCEYYEYKIRYYSLENSSFLLTKDIFLEAITSKTRCVIINSPNNPTGRIYSSSELEAILQIAKIKNIYVILDEVYEDIIYQKNHYVLKDIDDYIIRIKSFSKAYNLTGLRLGYILSGNKTILELKRRIRMSLISVPSFIQKIGASALKDKKGYKRYQKNRKIVLDYLRELNLDYVPVEGAFYVFIKIKGSSLDFAKELIDQEGIVIIPGIFFHLESYIRLSFVGKTKTLKKALLILKPYLKRFSMEI